MIIRDLEYMDDLSESKQTTGIMGGAKALFFSKSLVTPFFASNQTFAFASGKNLAFAAGTSGATYAAGPAGVFSTAGGNGIALGL